MSNILVTGAAGYLARSIIERLRPHHALTLFDRVAPQHDVAHGLSLVLGDVTCYDDVQRACAGQDAVVHTIALVRERFDKPQTLFADVMVKGAWNVAQACVDQRVARLINISSIVAIGWPQAADRPYRVGDPSTFRQGDLFYCLSKHLGEEIGMAYHQAHGLSVIHLRPGVIAGDGLNQGPRPPTNPSGPWFVYVDPRDVAQAVECALQSAIPYGRYNIVAGRSDSLFDWASARDELGYQPEHNWPEIPEQL